MRKRNKELLVMMVSLSMIFSACANTTESEQETTKKTEVKEATEVFADADFNDVSGEQENATIVLAGNKGTISDTTRGKSGSEVTITSKGIYKISGTGENVSIVVNDKKESGNIYLLLDNVTMKNTTEPCIHIESADKVIIQSEGKNTLIYKSTSSDIDGAVYSKDDLTVSGNGSISITSGQHGVVVKDELKITGSTVKIESQKTGIKVNDAVSIGGGDTSIISGHDAIQVENKEGTSYFHMQNASLTIKSEYDGISVSNGGDAFSGYTNIVSGTINIVTGSGSSNTKSSTSQKGIKCDGDILIGDAQIDVDSADDTMHSAGNIDIAGGTVTVSSGDDGIHADNNLEISGGTLEIQKSYEGMEAYNINIADGNVKIAASDDGMSVAGGSDSSSEEEFERPGEQETNDAILKIDGGNIYINSGGDGIDANGSIYITGGYVIVEGAENNFNGALDKGDGKDCVANITGGYVLAIGAKGMAINFDDGTQCSALVELEGKKGTEISADDGSDFTFTATKPFQSVVYSSPKLEKGKTYTIKAGEESATVDFSNSQYYSNIIIYEKSLRLFSI